MIQISENWKEAYPGARVGVLILNQVRNPQSDETLNTQKRQLEEQLRSTYFHYSREMFKEISVIKAYTDYYKSFKKTYHVLLQLESIALEGKPIPNVSAMVEAMFMAELKNILLTAGHDLDVLQEPITVDVAYGNESYILLNGKEQVLKAGDMFIKDRAGPISSIICGPDKRTCIRPETRNVLFTVYAPSGITAGYVSAHLKDMVVYIKLFSPETTIGLLEIYNTEE